MKIAVLDIGTNSIHLLVVEIRPDLSYEILDHEKDTTRLGDGSFQYHRLKKATMQKAITMVERFHKIAKRSGAKKILAVATSAVRDASNGRNFVRAVFFKTGIRVRIISGKEEGRLIFLAAQASVETHGKKTLVVDIGGGSVELILGDSKKHYFLDSFPLGVARLTDLYLHKDPPSQKELQALERHVERGLKAAVKEIKKTKFSMVIGTAGTVINLAAMAYEQISSRPLPFINHIELTQKSLKQVHDMILRMDLKERLKFPGLDPKRADIIVAGSTLVLTLMRLLKTESMTLSDSGIREGMVLDYIRKNKRKLKRGVDIQGIREKSVRLLARRWMAESDHSEQVASLALKIFDDTSALHGLGKNERELLEFSCLLHNIGYAINYKKNHRHTFYLIVNSDLDGFEPQEVEMMAWVACNHRKLLPKKNALHFVGSRGRRVIRVLSSILRIADGLDRSRLSVVKSLQCRVTPTVVFIQIVTSQDAELELWQAKQRADLFEKVFERKVEIKVFQKNKSSC